LFTPLAAGQAKPGFLHGVVASWFLVYLGMAITAVFLIVEIWGAGKSTMPLAGITAGTPLREFVAAAIAYSSAPTGIVSVTLIVGSSHWNAPANEQRLRPQSESSTPRN
jgi:hypothetical protein